MADDVPGGVDLLTRTDSTRVGPEHGRSTSMRRRCAGVVVVGMATAVMVAACSNGADPAALATIEGIVPEVDGGELYVATRIDGSCRTDCPPPGVSRGWVVDCSSLDRASSDYVDHLVDAGFDDDGDGTFLATVDPVQIQLTVVSYDDASTGPQPTEEPYVSDPSMLGGRCSLFVHASGEG